MSDSKKHHYLPELYIKGFTTEEGNLWIYNKKIGRIERDMKFPGGIFFETNLNTIILDSTQVKIVEEIYGRFENVLTESFYELKNSTNLKDVVNESNIGNLLVFITQLYWRSPFNSKHIHQLITDELLHDWGTFRHPFLSDEKISLKDKLTLIKLLLPLDILEDSGEKFISHSNVLTTECFLITDNPMIYPKPPNSKKEFMCNVIFPISTNRVYIGTSEPLSKKWVDEVPMINYLLMEQSSNYIGSRNRDFLETQIDIYKQCKSDPHLVDDMRQILFENLRGEEVL